ncbi:hypothetical protein H5410_003192 [Solanum commersonii]|uniref:DUF1985 domain-containing protein n=1 Tax=Solanum commersonii TaxID=4109 RepID=A0A9J6B4C9_SOLCO|nr:hypothetical protein H5410_003192 [Solanum commersonii]
MKLMKTKENKKKLRKKNKKKMKLRMMMGSKLSVHTFHVHLQPNVTSDSIIRLVMGKPFNTFRIMLKQISLEDFFRNSYFGHFLDLPKKNNARFQMTMVYELLKRRFIFQNPENKDEVLINYCGISLFFGRREFAIVSGLKCHPPSEPIPKFIVKKEPRRRKKGEKEETRKSTKEQDLVSFVLVGTSFKNPNLIYLLNYEDTSKKHKESLCLLLFLHNVLLAKDANNNISLKWVNLSRDIEAFNNYPWGHESFELTLKYLLKPLGPKTNNLFGFPWALLAWAFEVIPYLRHQIVHPWLVPTENELKMPYLITLGLVETLFDPVVDRVKMELAGARTIKRERVDNELVVFYGVDGVGIDDGGGDIGVGAGQDQEATSCRGCSSFVCEKCKKQDEDTIMYLQTLSQVVNEFKNKSSIKECSASIYSIYLITMTTIQPPQTLLCDNTASVATDKSFVATYVSYVATYGSSVATYASNGQTLLHTTTYVSYVTYGSSVPTFESHVTTDG